MSPARVLESIQKEHELQTLTAALDALLVTAHQLSLREQELQRRVNIAHDEYKRLADRVQGGITDVEKTVLEKILPQNDTQTLPRLDPSLKPLDVVAHLRSSGHIQSELADVVVAGIIYSRTIAERPPGNSSVSSNHNPCLVAAKARVGTRAPSRSGSARPSLYERDFTTINGVEGSLRCPFAKPTAANTGAVNGTTTAIPQDIQSSITKCGLDPIKADISQDRMSSAGGSARSSTAAARCPIRYMNDHSPEELAKYFENHKHEIPRSHAICVNRFQRNSATMRQIDAKYGSLVSMIQGLGEKHKPLLPEAEQNGTGPVTSSVERVEKWAEDVSSRSPNLATLSTVEEDTPAEAADELGGDRVGHFERSLREIRVGESPSRPWGIPLPVLHHQQPTPSALHSPAAQVHVHVPDIKSPKVATTNSEYVSPGQLQKLQDASPTPAQTRGKCPFDHEALKQKQEAASAKTGSAIIQDERHPEPQIADVNGAVASAPALAPTHEPKTTTNPSQMVFHGPVFFGYSAEETAALMQQLGCGR